MHVMGLSSSQQWISHFLLNLFKCSFTVIIMTMVLCMRIGDRAILNHTSALIIFIYLLLYSISAICYAFAISSFFTNGQLFLFIFLVGCKNCTINMFFMQISSVIYKNFVSSQCRIGVFWYHLVSAAHTVSISATALHRPITTGQTGQLCRAQHCNGMGSSYHWHVRSRSCTCYICAFGCHR